MFDTIGRPIGRRRVKRETDEEMDERFEGADLVSMKTLQRNPRYRLYVHRTAHGLHRMTLTDRNQTLGQKEGFEGCCVREMYTWRREVMLDQVKHLNEHADPPAYCETLITDFNAADRAGPISLDATPFSRAAFVPNQPPLQAVGRSR